MTVFISCLVVHCKSSYLVDIEKKKQIRYDFIQALYITKHKNIKDELALHMYMFLSKNNKPKYNKVHSVHISIYVNVFKTR